MPPTGMSPGGGAAKARMGTSSTSGNLYVVSLVFVLRKYRRPVEVDLLRSQPYGAKSARGTTSPGPLNMMTFTHLEHSYPCKCRPLHTLGTIRAPGYMEMMTDTHFEDNSQDGA